MATFTSGSPVEACSAEAGTTGSESYGAGWLGCQEQLRHVNAVLQEHVEPALALHSVPPLCLGTVGAYGQRMPSPHSKLELVLLCQPTGERRSPADEGYSAECIQRVTEAILRPLSEAGFKVTLRVATVTELLAAGRSDLRAACSILDFSFVGGRPELAEQLAARASSALFSGASLEHFLRAIRAQDRSRHRRYGDSVYMLEPDVQRGAGGLLDWASAMRCAKAAFHARQLGDLSRSGFISASEGELLAAAQAFALRVHALLHLQSGRATHALLADIQTSLAPAMGYSGVEPFMAQYFRHAAEIANLREAVLARASEASKPPAPPVRKTTLEGTLLVGGFVEPLDSEELRKRPALCLRLVDAGVEEGIPLREVTRRHIVRLTQDEAFCATLRSTDEARALFLDLLCDLRDSPFRGASAVAEMQALGLVRAMIPEFEPLVGRVHGDAYHVYTVDVHSVVAVEVLRRLCRGESVGEHAVGCRVAGDLPQRRVAFVATLLHDIGKVEGGEGHAERGAEVAGGIVRRLGLSPAETLSVQSLILLHLKMYQTATRRDLDDPRTIAEFLFSIDSRQQLEELYVLTVADVVATAPLKITPWKRRLLEQLFLRAAARLAGRAASPEIRLTALRNASRELLESRGGGATVESLEWVFSELPSRYLHARSAEDILAHACFIAESRGQSGARVRRRATGLVDVWYVGPDGPGLFSTLCAVLARNRLSVRTAEAYGFKGESGRRWALDLFCVQWPRGFSETAVSQLEAELASMGGSAGADEPAASQSLAPETHPERGMAPVVSVEVGLSSRQAIVEIIARDRPALLAWIAASLSRCGYDTKLVRAGTEGRRAVDVFHIARRDARRFSPAELTRLSSFLEAGLSSPGSALPLPDSPQESGESSGPKPKAQAD